MIDMAITVIGLGIGVALVLIALWVFSRCVQGV